MKFTWVAVQACCQHIFCLEVLGYWNIKKSQAMWLCHLGTFDACCHFLLVISGSGISPVYLFECVCLYVIRKCYFLSVSAVNKELKVNIEC